MTVPIIPDADIRRELRKMIEKQKSSIAEEWQTTIENLKREVGAKIAMEPDAVQQRKFAEAIDKMEAKRFEMDGVFEQFFAFVDNAQFFDEPA